MYCSYGLAHAAFANPVLALLSGPYGGGMHSEKEFMQLSSYQKRLIFATALIRKLNPATRTTPWKH
jgi:di/tripeptidase